MPAEKLLSELEAAIKANDQGRAAALTARLGEGTKPDSAAVFAVLRKYAVSEDGALHAEKFYRTATEEFAGTRAAFRWRQLTALARVTASAFGAPPPASPTRRNCWWGEARAGGSLHPNGRPTTSPLRWGEVRWFGHYPS